MIDLESHFKDDLFICVSLGINIFIIIISLIQTLFESLNPKKELYYSWV